MKSVLEVIQSTTSYFAKNEVESPRLNIEHLLAHTLGKKSRMELYTEFDRPLGESVLAPLRELVKRRAAGEPLQHLLGTVDFLGKSFRCDARALIPRPETEELVCLLRDHPHFASNPPSRIADIGTGSGIIALSLAAIWPETEAHAVDISADALALAQENAAALELSSRVTFHQGPLATPLSETFQLIVANLPYIPSSEIPTLSREVQRDPHLALDGGPDGLTLIRPLIEEIASKTHPPLLQGLLALEIGEDQSERVCNLLTHQSFTNVTPLRDLQGRQRFVLASHG
jgi:release factor glutamine methyltransferase